MVSLWLAIPAVLVLGIAWYLTWNAASAAGHIWRTMALSARADAEYWRARAKRAEEKRDGQATK